MFYFFFFKIEKLKLSTNRLCPSSIYSNDETAASNFDRSRRLRRKPAPALHDDKQNSARAEEKRKMHVVDAVGGGNTHKRDDSLP